MATKTCVENKLYESLKFCKGKTVSTGIRSHAYAIPKSLIASWPKRSTVEDDGASMGVLALYTGDFTLAADAKWKRIDLTDEKGSVSTETEGSKPNVVFVNKCTLQHPEFGVEPSGFAAMAAADDMVYLIPQRNGKYRVLGCEAYETTTKPTQNTGEGRSADDAGTSFEIEAPDTTPAPFYTGKIETEDGDISGADDSLVVATS